MLTQNLTLDDSSGDAIAYNLQAYLTDGARRIDASTTLDAPRTLTIQHSQSGKGADVVDRHRVLAEVTKANGAGIKKKGSVNLAFTIPQDTAISNTDILDLLAAIVDLVCDGGFGDSGVTGTTNFTAIVRGES
jgi:hypothetical protein